jgi:CRP-like cAMP-binding protein
MGRQSSVEFSSAFFDRVARAGHDHEIALLGRDASPRSLHPGDDLFKDSVRGCYLILTGFAARYQVLPHGRRQITALLLPGDLCDLRACFGHPLDHSVGALSAVEAAFIPREALVTQAEHCPEMLHRLWAATARDEAIARQWLLNLGQRSALERAAHLLCEIFARLQKAGLAEESGCQLPLTQTDLGDILALSSVHVNRTLMKLRAMNLIWLHHYELVVHDVPGLQKLAGFDPSYLGEGACVTFAGPAGTRLRM